MTIRVHEESIGSYLINRRPTHDDKKWEIVDKYGNTYTYHMAGPGWKAVRNIVRLKGEGGLDKKQALQAIHDLINKTLNDPEAYGADVELGKDLEQEFDKCMY